MPRARKIMCFQCRLSESPKRFKECRDCVRLYRMKYIRDYYAKNRPAVLKRIYSYRLENPEAHAANERRYRQNNRQSIWDKNKQWRERNHEYWKKIKLAQADRARYGDYAEAYRQFRNVVKLIKDITNEKVNK